MSLLYLGPELGGGMVALIVSFLVALGAFFLAIIWYPLKKIISFFRRKNNL